MDRLGLLDLTTGEMNARWLCRATFTEPRVTLEASCSLPSAYLSQSRRDSRRSCCSRSATGIVRALRTLLGPDEEHTETEVPLEGGTETKETHEINESVYETKMFRDHRKENVSFLTPLTSCVRDKQSESHEDNDGVSLACGALKQRWRWWCSQESLSPKQKHPSTLS